MRRIAGAPSTWHQRLVAGLLSLGRDGVRQPRGRGSAARLRSGARRPRRVHGRAPSAHVRGSSEGALDILAANGPHHDRRLRATATRTIVDLARARAPELRLQAAIESAVRTGASAPLVVERALSSARSGTLGMPVLDRVCSTPADTPMLERRFLRADARRRAASTDDAGGVPVGSAHRCTGRLPATRTGDRRRGDRVGAVTRRRANGTATRSDATSSRTWAPTRFEYTWGRHRRART